MFTIAFLSGGLPRFVVTAFTDTFTWFAAADTAMFETWTLAGVAFVLVLTSLTAKLTPPETAI